MPEYRNDSGNSVCLKNSQGNQVILKPGQTIVTTYFCDHEAAGITEVSPEPYFDGVLQENLLSALSSQAQNVNIHAEARIVLVHMITDAVTVRRNHDAALPVYRDQTKTDPLFFIAVDGIPGRTKQLRITGSGSCRVVQFHGNSN